MSSFDRSRTEAAADMGATSSRRWALARIAVSAAWIAAGCRPSTPRRPEYAQLPPASSRGRCVKEFGARGDGESDDTAAIQRALDSERHLFFPRGTYILRARREGYALFLRDKRSLLVEGDQAILRMADGESCSGKRRQMVMLMHCQDIVIRDLTIDGNRGNRPAPFETGSHCLDIRGGARILLERVHVLNSTSDGIYVRAAVEAVEATYPRDVVLRDVSVLGAYRNGLSLISGRRITVRGGSYSRTVGVPPEAGIDLEPTEADLFGLREVSISNADFEGNAGAGLVVTGTGRSRSSLVRVNGISGRRNRECLLSIGEADDVSVTGLRILGDDSGFTMRGLISVARSAQKVALANLAFQDISGATSDKFLIHIHAGGSEFSVTRVSAKRISCGVLEARTSCVTSDVRAEDVAGDVGLRLVNGTHHLRVLFAKRVAGHVLEAQGALFLEDLEIVDSGDRLPAVRIESPGSIIRRVRVTRSRPLPAGLFALYYDDHAAVGILEDFVAQLSNGEALAHCVRLPARSGSAILRRVDPSAT